MKLDLKADHTIYRLKNGERVPGVTTTQGKFEKQFLYGWYAEMEREGVLATLDETIRSGAGFVSTFASPERWAASIPSVVRQSLPVTKTGKPLWFANIKRDAAADLGKVAHAHVEARREQDSLEPDGIDPKMFAQGLILADRYNQKMAEEGFTCLHAEHVMVSETLRVGGTGDAFGKQNGAWTYRDLKTSKPWFEGTPYHENIAQSAGYAWMFEEQTGERVERIFIDRIGKTLEDKGDYWEVTPEQRKAGEDRFHLGIAAYYCDRRLGDTLKERSVA